MTNMKVSGIYRIVHAETGNFYVGSSVQVATRMSQHLSHLRRSLHKNAHLQAAFSLYGESAFSFDVVEECEPAVLLEREQHFIDALKPHFNICKVAGNTLGVKHTPSSKAKMSIANRGNSRMLGKTHSEETRRKISQKATGRTWSDEQRVKFSAAMRGNQHTKGRPLTEEHRTELRAATQEQWDNGARNKEAAAARIRAKWADPQWKAQQAERIKAGKAAAALART